jgi:hypothetical protein
MTENTIEDRIAQRVVELLEQRKLKIGTRRWAEVPGEDLTAETIEGVPLWAQKHVSVKELAETWGVSDTTILRLFRGEPGVLHVGDPNARRRTRVTLRIPSQVAERVHEKWGRNGA